MIPKQIAYVLFGIIGILLFLFGFTLYNNVQNKKEKEIKISTLISKFEKKFKDDSIYLANANKLLIDRISQQIIDSVSTSYEKKLELVVNQSEKYKQLLKDNDIFFDEPKEDDVIFTSNVTTYTQLKNKESSIAANDVQEPYEVVNNNVANNNAVTTSFTSPVVKSTNNNILNNNIVTISHTETKNDHLDIVNTKNTVSETEVSIINKKNHNLTHNNYVLDNAVNFNNIDFVPIHKGCENKKTENDRKNCFAVKTTQHIIKKFNQTNIKNTYLEKGIHKVRILFVIDENGHAKFGKILGDWPYKVYETAKKAVESTPKMKPGRKSNKVIAVKYSILIPFVVK